MITMKNTSTIPSYTDHVFLESVVTSVGLIAQAVPSQMITIKNCLSETIYCSDYLAHLIGINPKEIIGKVTWLPLYDNHMEIEKIIIAEDKATIENRVPNIVLKINRFVKGLTPYTSVKSPLITT